MYFHTRYGGEQNPLGDISWSVTRWRLSEKFGWPLDYIDSIPYAELLVYFGIQEADDANRRMDAELNRNKLSKRKRR